MSKKRLLCKLIVHKKILRFTWALAHKDGAGLVSILQACGFSREVILSFLKRNNLYNRSSAYASLTPAMLADVNNDYNLAIQLYRNEINSNTASPDSYLNLAHLLWVYGRVGLMSEDLIANEIQALIKVAQEKFPDYRQTTLFKLTIISQVPGVFIKPSYVDWMGILIPFNRNRSQVLSPVNAPFDEECDSFLQECDYVPTARNLFLKTILSNARESVSND